MTILLPETVNSLGKVSVVMVSTIANTAAPSLGTEINATTSVNVSCFLYEAAAGTMTTNKGQAPKKLCTVSQFQERGIASVDVGDLSYSHHPQRALTDAANKAKSSLLDGTRWYMVVRSGKAGDTALVAADRVDIWLVELLNQNRTTMGDGEFAQFSILQGVIAKANPIYESILAA